MNAFSLKITVDEGVSVLAGSCLVSVLENFEISKVKGCIGVKTQTCINVAKTRIKLFLFTQELRK